MDFEQQKQPQPYDSSLKALVQQQASDILPLFLPGATYEETLNVEAIRPTMRNVDHKLMRRVMDELKELHRDDEVTLAQQFVWMELLLARTDTVPVQEKKITWASFAQKRHSGRRSFEG